MASMQDLHKDQKIIHRDIQQVNRDIWAYKNKKSESQTRVSA